VTNDTLVIVAGDNGNWECKCNLSGVPGPFKGRWQKDSPQGGSSAKGTVFEAGHRVVGIFRWVGAISPGRTTNALLSSLDYLPTLAALAGVPLPTHGSSGDKLHFDGMDVSAVLFRGGATGHTTLAHPADDCSSNFGSATQGAVGATRWLHEGKEYKAVWITGGTPACGGNTSPCTYHDPPLLFELVADEAEARPLDTSKPPYSTVVSAMMEKRVQLGLDVNSTARTVTNFSTSSAGRAANCCNQKNFACAC
jgi:arylsulfatase A-like enzyme